MKQPKTPLSLGKRRGLAQCADENSIFSILALDHRQVIKDAFKDSASQSGVYEQAADFKRALVRALAPWSTAVLLDPSLGAGPAVADDSLPGRSGLVVAVEESGYADQPSARVSRVAAGWSAAKIKRMGASAVKLLVYYHPGSTQAAAMRRLVATVAEECKRLDIALFLEPLSYSTDPEKPKLPDAERREVIQQTARDLTPLGPDVLKTEFPVLASQQADETVWAQACHDLNEASCIPWVLLSAAVDYEVFQRQTLIACQAGASGILAGRAIWKEALSLPGLQRADFLQGTASERMRTLRTICRQYARPYTDFYCPPPIFEDWYIQYPDF